MLAIAGGKGGSGKTTTALGLARALARRGRHPVVVDCDCDMPNLHHLANVEYRGGVDELAKGRTIEQALQNSTAVPGVRLLTAGDREHVETALRRVRSWHGPVILDCPPGIGPDAVRPLRFATETLLVTTDQPQSIADTQTTAQSASELDTSAVGVVVRLTEGETDSEDRRHDETVRWPETVSLQTQVPTVGDPFDHPTVRQGWAEIATKLDSHREPHAHNGSNLYYQ